MQTCINYEASASPRLRVFILPQMTCSQSMRRPYTFNNAKDTLFSRVDSPSTNDKSPVRQARAYTDDQFTEEATKVLTSKPVNR